MKRRSATHVVKQAAKAACRRMGLAIHRFDRARHDEREQYRRISAKYRPFTMVPDVLYLDNLQLAARVAQVPGDVVECGVWRGGMSAGIAELLGNDRTYWLFDSFEGLPPAQPIDGAEAIQWQSDPTSERYFDNCTAEQSFAQRAMSLTGRSRVQLVKGWFKDSARNAAVQQIALLRLDGDWYESTMTCLEAFYPKVVVGGIVIIDDYHTWDGCSKAVHDYLSRHSLADRIQQTVSGNAFIVKRPSEAVPETRNAALAASV